MYPGRPDDRDEPRREEYEDAEDLRYLRKIRRPTEDSDLTSGDWLLCILCSGIGCIVGIVRLIQGKPNGGKMIAISLLFSLLWGILRVLIEASMQRR